MKPTVRRKVRFELRISKRQSQLKMEDFPPHLQTCIQPSPLPESEMQKLAERTGLVDIADPAWVVLVEGHNTCLELLEFLKTRQVDPAHFDLQASIVTELDHDGFDIPEYVLSFIGKARCKVGFSFISTLARRC
jgi:hypothetical protein